MWVRYDLILFTLVSLVSLLLLPKQGTTPSLGYNVFVVLATAGKKRTFHIHHWMYILFLLTICILSRGMSPSEFETTTVVALALIFSEILRYSDAFDIVSKQ